MGPPRRPAPPAVTVRPYAAREQRGWRRHGQARHPHDRRRSAGPSRRRAGPEAPVRLGLPHRGRRQRSVRPRCRPPTQASGHARRAVPGRPADARDDRHRAPPGRRGHPPRRQAGPAHGVRGHRGGDRRDQHHPPRPVPPQALGPARGAAVPGPRGPAVGLAGRLSPAVRGDPGRGPRLVGAWPRDQGLPRPQPAPVPLARHRDRPGGDRPGRERRCRRRAGAARGPGRRQHPGRAVERGDRGARRVADACRPPVLRPADRGRGSRGPGRSRLRRLRGPQDTPRRAGGARRPGRHDVAHRELPRVSLGPDRCRPRPPGPGAGDPPRRRDPHAASRRQPRDRRPVQGDHARRRGQGELPGAARRDRRGVPDARPARRGSPRRGRHLLRRRDHGGRVLPRPAGRGGRGRQLGGSGRGLPGQVRGARDVARPRWLACGGHVAPTSWTRSGRQRTSPSGCAPP